jgi:hypothetical protein
MSNSLLNSTSSYDEILTSVNGTFKILQGQFILLDNQTVFIDSSTFKIIIDGNPTKIFNYSINNKIVKLLKGETVFVVEIKIDNVSKYNIADPDEVDNLLTNALYMETPTILYVIYNPYHNIFTVKNGNMATLFMMEKIL